MNNLTRSVKNILETYYYTMHNQEEHTEAVNRTAYRVMRKDSYFSITDDEATEIMQEYNKHLASGKLSPLKIETVLKTMFELTFELPRVQQIYQEYKQNFDFYAQKKPTYKSRHHTNKHKFIIAHPN